MITLKHFPIIFLLINFSFAHVCPNSNYYVSNNLDLDNIKNCSIINGNLIINGGYNINNFSKLNNLEEIGGFLTIIDNHNISSLSGLNNLNIIRGDNLYLDTYSVVIKYNINENNDTHDGLCYPNNINWDNITNFPIDIRNNGINCPDCHSECNGCWGPGPSMCQFCINFNYNGTCVPHCPSGYVDNICDNVLPQPPILNGLLYNLNNIYLDWNLTNLNDFISGYKIWVNDTIHFSFINSDLGYYYNEFTNNYNLTDLNYGDKYNIQVSFINSVGESNKSNLVEIETEFEPTTPTTTQTTTPTTSQTTTITTTQTNTPTTTQTITPITTHTTTPTTTLTTSTEFINLNNIDNSNKWNDIYLIPIFLGFILIIILIIFIAVKYKTNKKNNRISPSVSQESDSVSSNSEFHTYCRLDRNNIPDSGSQNNEYNILDRKDRIITNNIYGSNQRDSRIYQNAVVRSFQNSIYNYNMYGNQ